MQRINSKVKSLVPIALFIAILIAICALSLGEIGFTHAAALSGDINELGFTIDTGTYINGNVARINVAGGGSGVPVITLTLTGELKKPNETSFMYITNDEIGIPENENWLDVPDKIDGQGVSTLSAATIVPDNTFYNRFIYFKSVIHKNDGAGVVTYEYIHPQFVNLIVDSSGDTLGYQINEIGATYKNEYGMDAPYNTFNPFWISSSVTFTARARNESLVTNFYYSIEQDAQGKDVWLPMTTVRTPEGLYYGIVTIAETYNGLVKFSSTDGSASIELPPNDMDAQRVIMLDVDTPMFEVTYLKDIPGEGVSDLEKQYTIGTYSAYDVIFTITPTDLDLNKPESRRGSAAKYYYHTGEFNAPDRIWHEIKPDPITNVCTLRRSETTMTLNFKAVSEAGKDSSQQKDIELVPYTTKIDKVAPKLNLKAVDGAGAVIMSLGTAPGAGYKVGYASDSVAFTATNSSVNESKVYFEYAIIGGSGEEVYEAREATAVYTKIFSDSLINTKFKFRAMSEAGLTSTVEFTVSILKSNYTFEWDRDLTYDTNTAGWANSAIKVYFRLPVVMDTPDEYAIYMRITGNAASAREMGAAIINYITEGTTKYAVYEAAVDISLNNQTLDFYAYNLANDRSAVLITPSPIKLDLETPGSTYTRQLYDSSVVLTSDNDWASGSVEIRITLTKTNISGVTVYTLYEGQRVDIVAPTGGIYIYRASVSGNYSFAIVSGADLQQSFTVKINIDTSNILFRGMTAETVDRSSGGEESKGLTLSLLSVGNYKLNETVSDRLTIGFDTNHQGHFSYLYQLYTGAVPGEGDAAYTLVSNKETFTIDIQNMAGSGELKYAFILESKAFKASGPKERTNPMTLIISFNTEGFTVRAEYAGEGGAVVWTSTEIEFSLTAANTSQSGNAVTVTEYQYCLIPASNPTAPREWISIMKGASLPDNILFNFGGVEHYDPRTGRELGLSYNGRIYFRAVNHAGKISDEIGQEIVIQIDQSMPNPLNAVVNSNGAEIREKSAGSNEYDVYSVGDVYYRHTNIQSEYAINYAPIKYYYISANSWTGGDRMPTAEEFNTLGTLLPESGNEILGQAYFFLCAENFTRKSMPIRVNIKKQGVEPPTATLDVSGGAVDYVTGIYTFNWQDMASVNITARSEFLVYYQYKIGANGEWEYYSPDGKGTKMAIEPGTLTLFFLGQERDGYTGIVRNFSDTVEFRVVNLAGAVCEFGNNFNKVIIRIDTRDPEFDMKLMSGAGGHEIDPGEWQSSEIYIELFTAERQMTPEGEKLVPIDSSVANPGGITYQYKLSENGRYENLPGKGTFFSTDDLIAGGYSGNGIVNLYIRATAKVSGNYVEKIIVLMIDKVRPDFEIRGQITQKNTANIEYISSGTWTQAEEVTLSRISQAESKSHVTYTYYIDNPVSDGIWQDDSSLILRTICLVTVVALSDAGLTAVRTFEVKIDYEPPVIHSGIIQNAVLENPDGTISIDRQHPNTYYIDQIITYTETNLKSAKYNNFPLANGAIIATNTVDNSNTGGLAEGKGGYVHIIVEDMAGNKSELIFYMTEFELDINTITLDQSHISLLERFEEQYEAGRSGLTTDRSAMFASQIRRLRDRLNTLQKEVDIYQNYLREINKKTLFTLIDDYYTMQKYLNYFTTKDETIRYPDWQQEMIRAGEYGAYYIKLETEFKKLEMLMSAVLNIQKSISELPAVNVVERSDYNNIRRVYDSYSSLSGTQKSVFNSSLYTKLIELKRKCEVMLLQDDSTGISIYGNDLAPGVAIEVLDYPKTTEFTNNAQITLLEKMPSSAARAVVYIKKIMLTDLGSQFETGTITVTLSIPKEYQNYIAFGVYRITTDGTVVPIDNFTINAYGDSVYFTTDSLDTYILTANAEITVRPPSDKIYAKLGNIEINAELLTYVTYAALGLFAVILIIVIIIALKHRAFLRKYNRTYKRSMFKRGVQTIPKGNKKARTNPGSVNDRINYKS